MYSFILIIISLHATKTELFDVQTLRLQPRLYLCRDDGSLIINISNK